MPDRQKELSDYRLQQAEESLTVAKTCMNTEFYKDSINLHIILCFTQSRQYLHLEQLISRDTKMWLHISIKNMLLLKNFLEN